MDEIFQSKTKVQKQVAQVAFTFPLWFPVLKACFTCFVNGLSFVTTVSQLNVRKKSEAGFVFFVTSFVLMNIFRTVSIGKILHQLKRLKKAFFKVLQNY